MENSIALTSLSQENNETKSKLHYYSKENEKKISTKCSAEKQEFERRKQEREEAQSLYKKEKREVFKTLSKKTKKCQPNLDLQVKYLLKKYKKKIKSHILCLIKS
ncbi:hypothetical protein HPG69_007348 [Diceros bicornis minor]|uniref:Uncharacterized protein n=1 Tax=Diceros bicornis minor TaxID=77932 RepID=A0A7J7EKQ2_DICBM|nr:hypothetical protein HPG69_007348 [Diceros bicornis minor]